MAANMNLENNSEEEVPYQNMEKDTYYIVVTPKGVRRRILFEGRDEYGDYKVRVASNFLIRYKEEHIQPLKFYKTNDQSELAGGRRRRKSRRRITRRRKTQRRRR